MLNVYDENGIVLKDEFRLTKFGKWLRSTSLDELPSLINVLKGEMSFVGPRPLLVEYLPLYSAIQRKRHTVRPGITGLAQINGRNLLTWNKKFEIDLVYIEKLSLFSDFLILFKTFKKVLYREGVNVNDKLSSERFTGKN
jgi:lipopolysaccharide/colanic/teichoic acid biosynthesis glycosyltransferase